MKLQIICRGSTKVGLGHLFRAHNFATAAAERHEVRIVAIAEPQLKTVFGELQNRLDVVPCDEAVGPLIQDFGADVIAFDLLDLQEPILAAAREQASLTVSLSPVFEQPGYLDLFFTRNPRQENIPNVKVYRGYEYAIFKKDHCGRIDDETYALASSHEVLPVAISMGGGDADNKTLQVLKALMSTERSCLFWIILGEGYQHSYQQLVECAREHSLHEVILAKTNRSMWRVMQNCALAVLAGGLTTVEAVYAGLPSVNLFERQEHSLVLQDLIERGACLTGGSFAPRSLQQTVSLINHLNRNRKALKIIRERSKGLFDTCGSQRILSQIEVQYSGARQTQADAQPQACATCWS